MDLTAREQKCHAVFLAKLPHPVACPLARLIQDQRLHWVPFILHSLEQQYDQVVKRTFQSRPPGIGVVKVDVEEVINIIPSKNALYLKTSDSIRLDDLTRNRAAFSLLERQRAQASQNFNASFL